jgi:hypothetical protein
MRDLALRAAGVLAVLVAVAHGVTAESSVFAKARVEPLRTRFLMRMVWQASTVSWIAIGVLLVAAPGLGSQAARHWIVAMAVIVYGYAAIGNALATGGRHVGWLLMCSVVALMLIGI